MATYTVDKIEYNGNVYNLQDNVSGYVTTNTTYTLSMSGNRITLTPSSGNSSYVDLPVYDETVQDHAGGESF